MEIVRDLHAEALVRLGLLMAPVPGLPPSRALQGARVEVQEAAEMLARLAARDVASVAREMDGHEDEAKVDCGAEANAKDEERATAAIRL